MRVNIQSVALRLVAIGLTALLFVLGLSGIKAIAKVNLIGKPSSVSGKLTAPQVMSEPDSPQTPQAAPLQDSIPNTSPPNTSSQDEAVKDVWNVIPFPTASGLMTSTSVRPDIISSRAPRQEFASADPTNFGDRYAKDIYGKPANNAPIVVLHETVGSASSAINTFQTPHPNEDDQVSYHSLIRLNGAVIYIVPPAKRAFGAGNSAYRGSNGVEAVKTHRVYPSSVNNFAYHISLESPEDGHNNASTHSGYTEAQYQSLAWLIAQTDVPVDRIVTHKIVDRSGSRIDPRSFDDRKFLALLRPYLQAMQEQSK